MVRDRGEEERGRRSDFLIFMRLRRFLSPDIHRGEGSDGGDVFFLLDIGLGRIRI